MTISFSCPHCGKKTEVADEYAGTSGPCSGCGQTVTMPGKPSAFSDPQLGAAAERAGPPPPGPPPKREGLPVWGILLIAAALLVPCLCVLPPLLLPAVQMAREAANRSACQNNLSRVADAIQRYHDAHGEFPPSAITDANGRPLHSWRVLVLPYFEDPELDRLYEEYDFDEPWDGFHNQRLTYRMPRVFGCPTEHTYGAAETSYFVVVGENTPMAPVVLKRGEDPRAVRSNRSFGDVSDGASRTVAVVEVTHSGVNWLEPADLSRDDAMRGINFTRSGGCVSSLHGGGANVAFLDGHVMFLDDEVTPETLEAMLDQNDGR
ncbi:MAG: DUF1559 domain-containing protein [Pirellulaceae bacterium]